LKDEKLKDKFTDDEKKTIEAKVDECVKFAEANPDAEAEKFETKQKELEDIFNPIMTKIYQANPEAQG